MGLQRISPGDPRQRGIQLRHRPTAALKENSSIRGLNKDHNHDLKGLFKGVATMASVRPGPFQNFYQALLAKGMKPTMARLTLARKIAAITLTLWKKGEGFDAEKLKLASRLSVSGEEPLPISGRFFLVVVSRFWRRSGSRVSMTMACRRTVLLSTQSLCEPYAPSNNPKKQ